MLTRDATRVARQIGWAPIPWCGGGLGRPAILAAGLAVVVAETFWLGVGLPAAARGLMLSSQGVGSTPLFLFFLSFFR